MRESRQGAQELTVSLGMSAQPHRRTPSEADLCSEWRRRTSGPSKICTEYLFEVLAKARNGNQTITEMLVFDPVERH